ESVRHRDAPVALPPDRCAGESGVHAVEAAPNLRPRRPVEDRVARPEASVDRQQADAGERGGPSPRGLHVRHENEESRVLRGPGGGREVSEQYGVRVSPLTTRDGGGQGGGG